MKPGLKRLGFFVRIDHMHHWKIWMIALGTVVFCQCKPQQTIEDKLMDCIEESFRREGIDIRAKLDSLESFLIQQKILNDASGQSYFDFFSEVESIGFYPDRVMEGEISEYYDRAELNVLGRDLYNSTCINLLKQTDQTNEVKSKFFQLQQAKQERIKRNEGYGVGRQATEIKSFIKPSDFNHPFYKAFALQMIAKVVVPAQGIPITLPSDQPHQSYSAFKVLEITINDKSEVFWEQEKVSLLQLEEHMKAFIARKLNSHYISLRTSKSTNVAIYQRVVRKIYEAYDGKRDEEAKRIFGQGFFHLSKANQAKIIKRYPLRAVAR